jgi:hypothetical protein
MRRDHVRQAEEHDSHTDQNADDETEDGDELRVLLLLIVHGR